jgi:hypothetical protein
MFEVKGDKSATKLFEFFADTKSVEWTHAEIGDEKSERNIVGTSHQENSTILGSALNGYGYSLRRVDHNHPNGNSKVSDGDRNNRSRYLSKNPNVKLNIYTVKGGYRPYTTLLELLRPYPNQ